MKTIIACDSTIDLSPELIKKYELKVLPLITSLGEDSYFDGERPIEDMYKYVAKTGELPKTATRGIDDFSNFYKELLKDGSEVVFVSLGSEMSSTYNNAVVAAREVKGVYVVNSTVLSSGTGLLAIYASELAKQGLSAKEIFEKCEARSSHIQASFIIENVKFLYKGGRCSMIAMLGANLLRIKPCIQVVNGTNKVTRKYMGNIVSAVTKYCEDTLKTYNTPDTTRCMITYSTATPEIIEAAKNALEKYGKFKEILITQAGSVINSHCGKNTIGILYINDGKN